MRFSASCFLYLTSSSLCSLSSSFTLQSTPKTSKNLKAASSGSSTDSFSEPEITLNRRDFTKKSTIAVGTATAAAMTQTTQSALASPTASPSGATANTIKLPPLGLGAWAWGDSLFWGYDKKNDNELKEVFDYALSRDIAFFDTAELYGLGRSETLLGQFTKESDSGKKVQIATKFAAIPTRTKPKDVVNACKNSLKRLDMESIELYQIHFPNAWANEEYWEGLAQCYELGLIQNVGVSNYGVDALKKVHGFLQNRNIPLATNQIQVSLLYRWPLENDLLKTCEELDVKVLSYSPLALGFLTGKYNKDKLPSGPRKKLGEKLVNEPGFLKLQDTMKSIASGHSGDTTVSQAQVALNWLRAKNTIPIPGARNLKQAKQNIDSLKWELSKEEVDMLDEVVKDVPNYIDPAASPFPKKDINTGLVMYDS